MAWDRDSRRWLSVWAGASVGTMGSVCRAALAEIDRLGKACDEAEKELDEAWEKTGRLQARIDRLGKACDVRESKATGIEHVIQLMRTHKWKGCATWNFHVIDGVCVVHDSGTKRYDVDTAFAIANQLLRENPPVAHEPKQATGPECHDALISGRLINSVAVLEFSARQKASEIAGLVARVERLEATSQRMKEVYDEKDAPKG